VATSRSRGALRRGRRARTGRIETRFRALLRTWSPPLAPDRAPPCRAHACSKGGTLRAAAEAAACAPDVDPRGPSISRSPVPHLPAKADAFSRRPRCVRPPLGSPVRGDRSPRPFEWASVHATRTPLSEEERASLCDLECQRLFYRPVVPGVTCQAPRCGSIDRREKGVRFRLPLTLAGQSQRLRRLL
jgi:hypothetical protein